MLERVEVKNTGKDRTGMTTYEVKRCSMRTWDRKM
jgi:hypothetical protein